MSCSGENCNSTHIQNKKYNLCGDCVYKKNHKGKSRQEILAEKQQMKWNMVSIKVNGVTVEENHGYGILGYSIDDISAQNARNQELAEQQALSEMEEDLKSIINGTKTIDEIRLKRGLKKRSKPKQISAKQYVINKLYKLTCIDMDYTTDPVCSGCGKYQGGDIKLSHSHIISREDCKRIGRPELIYDKNNIHYHCMNYGYNNGCHNKWEVPTERHNLLDYKENIEYIKSISEELYLKYTKHVG